MFDILKSPRNIGIAIGVVVLLVVVIALAVLGSRGDLKFGDSTQQTCALSGITGKRHQITDQLQDGDMLVSPGILHSPDRSKILIVGKNNIRMYKITPKHPIALFVVTSVKQDGNVTYAAIMEVNTKLYLTDLTDNGMLSETPAHLPYLKNREGDFVKLRFDEKDSDILLKVHRTDRKQKTFGLMIDDFVLRSSKYSEKFEKAKQREDWVLMKTYPLLYVNKSDRKLLISEDEDTFDTEECWRKEFTKEVGGLVAQSDGNLVLYERNGSCNASTALWSSETWTKDGKNRGPYTLSLSNTGVLLWRNRQGALVWHAKCDNDAWKCTKTSWGKWQMVRRDGLRNIECHSRNGRDCVFFDRPALCAVMANDMNRGVQKEASSPLTCGDDHKKVWGTRGDDDPKHWCFKGRTDI